MVAPRRSSKTSSLDGQSRKREYSFENSIKANWSLAERASIKIESFQENFLLNTSSYNMAGRFSGKRVDAARWKDPPHRYFLNLRAIVTEENSTEVVDPDAMLTFARCYGPLFFTGYYEEDSPSADEKIWIQITQHSISMAHLLENAERFGKREFKAMATEHSQPLLRFAWQTGNKDAVEAIAEEIEDNLHACVNAESGEVTIGVKDAWTLICMLILRDHAAGRLGICQNPGCPAPYFLKSRKTQKICEAGECVVWAQRKYALKWWTVNRSATANRKRQHSARGTRDSTRR